MRTPVIGFRDHPGPVRPHLNSMTSAKTLCQNEITFTSTWDCDSAIIFLGDTVQPVTELKAKATSPAASDQQRHSPKDCCVAGAGERPSFHVGPELGLSRSSILNPGQPCLHCSGMQKKTKKQKTPRTPTLSLGLCWNARV